MNETSMSMRLLTSWRGNLPHNQCFTLTAHSKDNANRRLLGNLSGYQSSHSLIHCTHNFFITLDVHYHEQEFLEVVQIIVLDTNMYRFQPFKIPLQSTGRCPDHRMFVVFWLTHMYLFMLETKISVLTFCINLNDWWLTELAISFC